MGVVYVNVYVSKRLKEELAWAIDKRFGLLVIEYYLKLLYHKETKEYKAVLNLKQYCIRYYVTLSNVF